MAEIYVFTTLMALCCLFSFIFVKKTPQETIECFQERIKDFPNFLLIETKYKLECIRLNYLDLIRKIDTDIKQSSKSSHIIEQLEDEKKHFVSKFKTAEAKLGLIKLELENRHEKKPLK